MVTERIPSFAEATRLAQDRLRVNARLSRGHAGMTVDHAVPTMDCACGGHQRAAYDVDAFRSLAQDAASLLNDVAALTGKFEAQRQARVTADAAARATGRLTADERRTVLAQSGAAFDRATTGSRQAGMNARAAAFWANR